MQKGQTLIFQRKIVPRFIFLLVGVLILAVAGGAFYVGKSSTPKPSPNQVVTSQTPQPTPAPSGEFRQITFSSRWIKYQPSCKILANNIEIYYPDNWLLKEFDETHGDIQACYILFGYPVQPQSYQAPTPNQLATFTVHAFLDKEETLDHYIDTIKKQDPIPMKVSKVVMNNKEYTRFDFEKKCCADTPALFYTSQGQIFFRIQTVSSHGYTGLNLNQAYELDSSTIESLNNEFLKRIKFLQTANSFP